MPYQVTFLYYPFWKNRFSFSFLCSHFCFSALISVSLLSFLFLCSHFCFSALISVSLIAFDKMRFISKSVPSWSRCTISTLRSLRSLFIWTHQVVNYLTTNFSNLLFIFIIIFLILFFLYPQDLSVSVNLRIYQEFCILSIYLLNLSTKRRCHFWHAITCFSRH